MTNIPVSFHTAEVENVNVFCRQAGGSFSLPSFPEIRI